ncbi:MAG: hypothetical protein ACFFDL_04490 [Promethearchaeota archaeon]
MNLNISVYDSYFELSDIGTLPVKGNIHVEFKGIIPFKSIIPIKKVAGKFPSDFWEKKKHITIEEYLFINEGAKDFQILFDPKYGWEKIPKFFEALNENLNKIVVHDSKEYQASLERCFIGPYILTRVIFEKNKEKYPDVIKVLKNQNFANPPRNVNGLISILEIKDKKLNTEKKEFHGIKLPAYEIEAIEIMEALIGRNLNIVDFIEAGTIGIMVKEEHVNGVGVAGMGLKTLHESLFNLKNLYLLDLQRNNFSSLPELIGNLKLVKECFLDDNQLKALPKAIGAMKSLKLLGLEKNKLSTLPDEIGNLKEIEILILQENELISLPISIGGLPLLRMLGLRYNKLSSLPEEIGNLESLQGLDLRNNQLTHLPNSIGNLTSLTHLHVENNKLNNLPDSIVKLKSLKQLNLRKNQFADFSDSINQWISELKNKGCEVQMDPRIIAVKEEPKIVIIEQIKKSKNPIQFIEKYLKEIPTDKRAKELYKIGKKITNVKITTKNYEPVVKESDQSDVNLGTKIMELAIDLPNCPKGLFNELGVIYTFKNKWDKALLVFEKAIKQGFSEPMFIAGIINAAFLLGRQDVIDEYLEFSLKNDKVLNNPYSLSNVLYALNRKETKEASELALKLVSNYWNKKKRKMIPSLWVNMTDAYIVADKIDENLVEIVNEGLQKLDQMHPVIYENLAWFYLKKGQIEKVIQYLKEAKKKGHPGFKELKNSKYFKKIRDNPDFISLFN